MQEVSYNTWTTKRV